MFRSLVDSRKRSTGSGTVPTYLVHKLHMYIIPFTVMIAPEYCYDRGPSNTVPAAGKVHGYLSSYVDCTCRHVRALIAQFIQ